MLICHHDNPLNRRVLPRFLGAFSDLVGVVVIAETKRRRVRRLRAEIRRSGVRVLDVAAFKLYYRARVAGRDRAWIEAKVAELERRYPAVDAPVLRTRDPNSESTRAFLERLSPDIVLARCKTLLRPAIFDIPAAGTFVLHPGICPEYRNAHGCFWALARRDVDKVGATLLKIDEGVDTGPVFAYFTAEIDERRESHVVIEYRVVFDNLDRIADALVDVVHGRRRAIDVRGRSSAVWGQPRFSAYRTWKRAARPATS